MNPGRRLPCGSLAAVLTPRGDSGGADGHALPLGTRWSKPLDCGQHGPWLCLYLKHEAVGGKSGFLSVLFSVRGSESESEWPHREPGTHSVVPGAGSCSPCLLPPRICTGREQGSGADPGMKARHRDVVCGCPRWRACQSPCCHLSGHLGGFERSREGQERIFGTGLGLPLTSSGPMLSSPKSLSVGLCDEKMDTLCVLHGQGHLAMLTPPAPLPLLILALPVSSWEAEEWISNLFIPGCTLVS